MTLKYAIQEGFVEILNLPDGNLIYLNTTEHAGVKTIRTPDGEMLVVGIFGCDGSMAIEELRERSLPVELTTELYDTSQANVGKFNRKFDTVIKID